MNVMITRPDVPAQMVSWEEKKKDNFRFFSETGQAYINMSCFSNTSKKEDLEMWYRVYNGEKIDEHYIGFEDPYGTRSTTNPMKLNDVKPWNILKSNIDIVRNEKELRPWRYYVSVKNSDSITMYENQKTNQMFQIMEQLLVNSLNERNIQTGLETQDVRTQDLEKFYLNYRDKRAEQAQRILNVALAEEKVRYKLNREGMFHWLIAGEVISYLGEFMGDYTYEIINPMNIDFIKGPNTKYGCNAEAVVRRELLPLNFILDNMRDIVPTEDIMDMELDQASGRSIDYDKMQIVSNHKRDTEVGGNLVETFHVCWKGYKQVFHISYNENGIMKTATVDETFNMEEFVYPIENVEPEWYSTVYEIYKIRDEFYGAQELSYLARRMTNKSPVQLPYNNKMYSDVNATNTSVIKENYIYQFYWNIYKAKLERLIAVDKGSVAIVDIAALNDWGLGQFNIDRTLEYIDKTKILFINSNDPDFKNSFNQHGAKLDFSQDKAISGILAVLVQLRQELDQNMGIFPQRKGDIKASAGKATTEEAISRSYVISEGIFSEFEDFEAMELNRILDLTKHVYSKEDKKGLYVVDAMPLLLDPDPEVAENEYGIEVIHPSKDKRKLEKIESIIQPFAQNVGKEGINHDTIIDLIDSDNIPEIKKNMKRADEELKRYYENVAKKEHERNMEALKEKERIDDKAIQNENLNNELDRQKDIYVATIQSEGTSSTPIQDFKDNTKPLYEQLKINFDLIKHNDEMKDRQEKRKHEKELKKMDLQNPVVGEKTKKSTK